MSVEEIQSGLSQRFCMMREARCCSDQKIFQQEHSQSNEIYWLNVLELVDKHIEQLLWSRQKHRHPKLNAVSCHKHAERKHTQTQTYNRHRARETICHNDDPHTHHEHQQVVAKIFFIINSSRLFRSIELMEHRLIYRMHVSHHSFPISFCPRPRIAAHVQ